MIRANNQNPQVLEFTSFKKKEAVSDDDLIHAVLKFEALLAQQPGILFHCLVRNYKNEYANVLFAESESDLTALEKNIGQDPDTQSFFSMVESSTVEVTFHKILTKEFRIPINFSCVEKGVFKLKDVTQKQELLNVSTAIENEYLNSFKNTKAHFIGEQGENKYSEFTFGETLGKTKEICLGYLSNSICIPMLSMAEESSMEFDFWYLIA